MSADGGAFPISRQQLVVGFPPPPGQVKQALVELGRKVEAPKTGDADADAAELARLEAKHAALPRPWIPASCPPLLRRRLWLWLDHVATWLNRDYLWRPDKMIPPCWVAHPPIAHELAVLAFLRHDAEHETDPKALEEWHRHSLPMFIDRMTSRLTTSQGTQLCETVHDRWPGLPAYIQFTNDKHQHDRHEFFAGDTATTDRATPAGHRTEQPATTGDRTPDTDSDTVIVDRVSGVVTEPSRSTDPDDPGPDDPTDYDLDDRG